MLEEYAKRRTSPPVDASSSGDSILRFTGSCPLRAIRADYSIDDGQKANEKMKQRGSMCQNKNAIASIERPAISTP